MARAVLAGCAALVLTCATNGAAQNADTTPHSVQFVTVATDVKLEVLDWGGPASADVRTLVLLAGLSDNAHRFDPFATKLIERYRVFGISRRGAGASSAPSSGYSSDGLADDVLAVMESLKVRRPILVGHSFGGAELSSIGSRYPAKVSGLIYLDGAHEYAFAPTGYKPNPLPGPEVDIPPVIRAIVTGIQQYTHIPVPALAIFAVPRRLPLNVSDADRAQSAAMDKIAMAQADAFEKGVPTARVVRLPNAGHFVHRTNEMDVLRLIEEFVAGLK
ncbi:MAG TPA: alpha/beta hydrolase [Vicinamibacterales bacterium]|nr:alpha/beta hydrolase [Vicinamibacterales bacterium]